MTQIWGKLLGALFGFMFARIPGAILGLVVGHMFDKGYSQDFDSAGGFSRLFGLKAEIQNQAIFFHHFFAVMGHIAKAKGRVSQQDITNATALMDQMNLTGSTRQEAQQAFTEGKSSSYPLKDELRAFKRACYNRKDILLIFLEMQIQVNFIADKPNQKQLDLLLLISQTLGFNSQQLEALINSIAAEARFHRSYSNKKQQQNENYSKEQSLNDAYKILEIEEKVSDQAVKKAYRKLMARHHPDKLQAKGLPKEAMELTKQRAQDISVAYELIKKNRNF